LVVVSAGRKRRRGGGGATYLSPLTQNPIPRYFSTENDSEVILLLDGTTAPAPAADLEPQLSPAEAPASEVEDSSNLDEEFDLESVVVDELDMPELKTTDDVFSDDTLPVDEAIDEDAGPEEGAGNQPGASVTTDSERESLEGIDLDVGDEPGGEDSGENMSEAEISAELEVEDAAPPEASAPEVSDGQGQEDVDDLWGEAFAEQEAAEGGESAEAADVVAENAVESPEMEATASSEGGEEDADDLWAEAFAEQEAAEGGESAEAAGEVEAADAPQAADGDDMSGMWDEAFAEQEAASEAAEAKGGGPDAPGDSEASGAAEMEMEKLWDEALTDSDGAGEELAASSEEGQPAGEPDEESSEEEYTGGDIISQGDLDALLGGGDDKAPENEPDDVASSALNTLEIDEDEEIEAFIVEEEAEDALDDGERVVLAEEEIREGEPALLKRLVAGGVDAGVVGGVEIVFMLGTHFIIAQIAGSIFANMEALALVLALDLVVFFLLSLVYSVYFVGGWGRTPGHRCAGLIVVDLGDRPVGYMQSVLRYFGTLAAVLPAGLGHLLIIMDKQGRGLGDRLAGTKVVYRSSS